MTFEGSLWTGRIYDHKKIKELFPDANLICVMRWPPKFISLKKENIQHMLSFAPSIKLLQWYKKEQGKTRLDAPLTVWEEYIRTFVLDFYDNAKAKEDRFFVRRALQEGKHIVLLCHEKGGENCHRRLLPYLILGEDEMDVYKGEHAFEPITVQGKLDWW